MGYIKEDVKNNYNLSNKDISIAKFFTNGFNINYGDVIKEQIRK